MIGKPEWFAPRKYGWGLGVRTKEGWLYILAFAVLAVIVSMLPLPVMQREVLVGVLAAVLVLDVLHIMLKVYSGLDERLQIHEAMAERNSSFVAVACLLGYAAFEAATAAPEAGMSWAIAPPLAILVLMALAKGSTLLYLERMG
jgi:hypothetical protein